MACDDGGGVGCFIETVEASQALNTSPENAEEKQRGRYKDRERKMNKDRFIVRISTRARESHRCHKKLFSLQLLRPNLEFQTSRPQNAKENVYSTTQTQPITLFQPKISHYTIYLATRSCHTIFEGHVNPQC